MFEQIKIPKAKSKIAQGKCNCGNTKWLEEAIEISPVIAGGLILGWSFKMRLSCTFCRLVIHSDIGNFDDNIKQIDLDSIFCMSNEKYIERLRELNLTQEILKTYRSLASNTSATWVKDLIGGKN